MYCQVTKHLICPSHCSLENIISVLPSGQKKHKKRQTETQQPKLPTGYKTDSGLFAENW